MCVFVFECIKNPKILSTTIFFFCNYLSILYSHKEEYYLNDNENRSNIINKFYTSYLSRFSFKYLITLLPNYQLNTELFLLLLIPITIMEV